MERRKQLILDSAFQKQASLRFSSRSPSLSVYRASVYVYGFVLLIAGSPSRALIVYSILFLASAPPPLLVLLVTGPLLLGLSDSS